MIISSSDKSLSEILKDFKKFTSSRIALEIENINESRRDGYRGHFLKPGKNWRG